VSSAAALDDEPAPTLAADVEPPRDEASHTAAPAPVADADLEPTTPALPDRYGVDRFEVLVRDPGTLFAWWEVDDAGRAVATEDLAGASPAEHAEPIVGALRVAARSGTHGEEAASWIVSLPPRATSRHVDVPREHRAYDVTLGLARGGRFVPLSEIRRVEMPASAPSQDETIRWRAVGGGEATPQGETPSPQAIAELRETLRGTAPSSGEWGLGHRLQELDIGGSHTVPSS
jgi:hypothetical protein